MEQFEFTSEADGLTVHAYQWRVTGSEPVGTVQLAHGLAEHAPRYDRLARALTGAGFEVWANDHRGHGHSIDETTPLGSFGPAGWQGLLDDVVQLSALVEARTPGLPHFLVAHSMGSFAAQLVILDHSRRYQGVVLTGSTAIDVLGAALPEAPPDAPGDLSAFNAGFEFRTGYEWLSRDEAEVDAYVADPLCGFPAAPDVLPSLLSSTRSGEADQLAKISPSLPILVVSGSDDPLAGQGDLVRILAQRYRDAGVVDVDLEIYPGARHEVFNETNRDEITALVIGWLRQRAGDRD